jgi:hypothetical protein
MTYYLIRVGIGLIWTFYLSVFAWAVWRGRQARLSEAIATICALINIAAIDLVMWLGLFRD